MACINFGPNVSSLRGALHNDSLTNEKQGSKKNALPPLVRKAVFLAKIAENAKALLV